MVSRPHSADALHCNNSDKSKRRFSTIDLFILVFHQCHVQYQCKISSGIVSKLKGYRYSILGMFERVVKIKRRKWLTKCHRKVKWAVFRTELSNYFGMYLIVDIIVKVQLENLEYSPQICLQGSTLLTISITCRKNCEE